MDATLAATLAAEAPQGSALIAPRPLAAASPDASQSVAPVPPAPPPRFGSRVGRGWAFVPLAPLVVVLVGLAVAVGIGLVGLDHLARAGDDHAGARAELL